MKKTFKFYAIIWAILVAAFNAVIFLVRPVIPGCIMVYDARFWIAWSCIIAAFVGNFVCAFFALKSENLNKTLYRISLVKVTWAALIVMIVVGAALITIPDCPAWIAAIVCAVVFALSAIATVKALAATETVKNIDEEIKAKTAFVKLLTVDAENTLARAKTEEMKDICRKVYEAARYSDPMSSDALVSVEERITSQFRAFEDAVRADDAELVKSTAEELLALIGDRNRKCKVLK